MEKEFFLVKKTVDETTVTGDVVTLRKYNHVSPSNLELNLHISFEWCDVGFKNLTLG